MYNKHQNKAFWVIFGFCGDEIRNRSHRHMKIVLGSDHFPSSVQRPILYPSCYLVDPEGAVRRLDTSRAGSRRNVNHILSMLQPNQLYMLHNHRYSVVLCYIFRAMNGVLVNPKDLLYFSLRSFKGKL
jgi:hypothetical protein